MARGDAVWGEDDRRKSGKRKNRAVDGALKWDVAAVQKAQVVAAASRSAGGSGAAEAEGAPEVAAGKKRRRPACGSRETGLRRAG
eukprot:8011217-Pyramimonas_sp.AAC.1